MPDTLSFLHTWLANGAWSWHDAAWPVQLLDRTYALALAWEPSSRPTLRAIASPRIRVEPYTALQMARINTSNN